MDTLQIKVYQTFRDGLRHKAVEITTTAEMSWQFKLGYYLWGMDVWCGNIPVLKVLIGVNILNMILMWIAR